MPWPASASRPPRLGATSSTSGSRCRWGSCGCCLGLGLALGIGLALITIGIPILAVTLLLWKAGANLERKRAVLVLGREIPGPRRATSRPAGSRAGAPGSATG